MKPEGLRALAGRREALGSKREKNHIVLLPCYPDAIPRVGRSPEVRKTRRTFPCRRLCGRVGRGLWIGAGGWPAHHHIDASATRPVGGERVGFDRHLDPRPGTHRQGMVQGGPRGWTV